MAANKNTNLALLLLVICNTYGIEKPYCSTYKDQCATDNPDDVLATLTCMNGQACESSKETEYPAGSLTFDTMTVQLCKQSCAEETTDTCFYYKFRQIGDLEKKCFFMSQDQCKDWDLNGCESPTCESGEAVDDSCQPPDNGVVPKDYTCPGSGPDTHHPGIMPDYVLRWQCKWNLEDIDIYTNDAIPGDTVCTAKPMCGSEEIKYTCVEDPNTLGTGKWQFKDGNDGLFLSEKKLVDPNCNAKELTIDGYESQSDMMDIQCIPEGQGNGMDADGKIKAQNSCLMLCDDFPVLHFYTVKNEWKYIDMLDSDAVEADLPDTADSAKNIIYCHKP